MASETVTREDLKQILNKVLPTGLTDKSLYHYEEVSLSNGSASTYYGTFSISLPSVEGYKPIAARNIGLNQVNKNIYQVGMSDTTLTVGVSNISLSGTIGSLYIYATIVYIKESVLTDGAAIADYVVEEGTDGIWTYRKWNSGIAECWGATALASHSITSAYGSGYWTHEYHTLPSGLFTSVTNAQANRVAGDGLAYISIDSVSTSSVGCYIADLTSHTVSFSIYFSVKGRWK